jgi:hypothetical protein
MPPPLTPKRLHVFINTALRFRIAGSSTSFLPASALADSSSDTEDEHDEETAQFYLDKMSDDINRKTETVFGKGVRGWKEDGIVYADLEDVVKREKRAEGLWGRKDRKRNQMTGEDVSELVVGAEANPGRNENAEDTETSNTRPLNPPNPFQTALPNHHRTPGTTFPLPHNRLRCPTDTQFHHGSAALDPLGAYNRAVKPLRSRQQVPLRGTEDGVKKIVSGSFGMFDGGVSRFDGRGYRMGLKKEEGDVFKGMDWLWRYVCRGYVGAWMMACVGEGGG